MVKIESGIPLPMATPGRQVSSGEPYVFKDMKVGDSVFYEMEGDKFFWRSKPAYAAQKYGQRTGKKFSTRKVEGGLRIWRVE